MKFVNHNGELIEENQPLFSISNRGFRYGDSLFETMRVANGSLCFFDEHFSRLSEGMQFLQMECQLTKDQLNAEVTKLLVANGITSGGRVRLSVYRNEGGLYTPEVDTISFVIEASEYENSLFELNKKGLTIDIFEGHRKTINQLTSIKSNNCLTYILAGKYKKEKGFDEAVLLNELGSVAECVSSNLFVAYNGVIYTPSENQGIINGIMRQQIIAIAKENKIEVQECPLTPQVLIRADEVFLTNVVSGIKWVGAYRTKRYFNNVSTQLIAALNKKITSLSLDKQAS